MTDSSDNQSIKFLTAHNLSDRSDLDVQVFQSFDELSQIQQEWDQFMESVGAEIFLTYDWCRLWWKYYGNDRQLMIFIFKSEGKIVGILPTFFEKIWLGPFFAKIVKIVGTDFMPVTITVPIKGEFLNLALAKFIDELSLLCNWDILYIGAICGRFNMVNNLLAALKKRVSGSHGLELMEKDVQTYFALEETWEKQVGNLSKKHRDNMRRAYRLAEKEGLPLNAVLASNGNLAEYFEDFVRLHQSRWQSLGQAGHFTDWPLSYEFHKDISHIQLRLGRLRLLKINLGESCLGYKYGYKFGETYCSFLTGRGEIDGSAKIDFNRIAFGEQAKKAISEEAKWIDGMRGQYSHKIELGGKLQPIKKIFVYSQRNPAQMRIRMFRVLAWALDACYSKIWRRRVAPRLGRKPKRLCDAWIRTHFFAF